MDDERDEELSSISAIYPEIVRDAFTATIDIPVTPSSPVPVQFPSVADSPPSSCPTPPPSLRGEVKSPSDIHHLTHLPPLRLRLSLPDGYPSTEPPQIELDTAASWLSATTLQRLVDEAPKLWEDYGRGQIIFAYIDFLQQEAEKAFDLVTDSADGVLEISQNLKIALLDYDMKMKRQKFNEETFDCGVCLEPRKGDKCYRMSKCGHVFCVACLQDFYNNCITTGDVASVKCIDPGCGNEKKAAGRRRRKSATLSPNELLQIPLTKDIVVRYIDIKRKKKLESDKSTIYCPRQWCQGPARSKKYPKVADPFAEDAFESDSEDEMPNEDSTEKVIERLAICEDCDFAFCRVCLASWHGDFFRCGRRTKEELSAEEKASDEFIRMHTSPCPTCGSPSQKTHGCNHMKCFQCATHFCYLCSSWLNPSNPYEHFNTKSIGCYQRLWDLEEGDNGQGNVRFLGARGAEAAAVAAERAEHADAAAEAAAQEEAFRNDPARLQALENAMAQLNIVVGDRPRAVQQPARNQPGRNQPPQPAVEQQHRPRQDMVGQRLQRFLEMVRNDQEDEWDSDELDDDENDEGWEIPHA